MRGHIRERQGATGSSWELRVHVGRGKYVTRTVRGGRRAAERALTKLLAEVDDGRHTGKGTVAELLARWEKESDWAPSTRDAYLHYINRHILPALGAKPLRQVKPDDLNSLYRSLRSSLAPASIYKVHTILHRAFDRGIRWGMLAANPADRADPPKVPRPLTKPAQRDDIERLLVEAERSVPWFVAYLVIAAQTGARRGELAALRWSDVDFDRAEVVLARSLTMDGGAIVEKSTKTGRARRIAISGRTVEALRRYRETVERFAELDGVALAADGFVFSPEVDGSRPFRPDGVTQQFMRVRNRAGVDGVRLHDLRHYVATELLAKGVPVGVVADRLGHAHASTTLNVYRGFVPAADREAAELL